MGRNENVPDFPAITVRVFPDTTGEVVIAGQNTPIEATGDVGETRRKALYVVTQTAVALGRPVRSTAEEADETSQLVVRPDGTVEALSTSSRRGARRPDPNTAAPVNQVPAGPTPAVDDELADETVMTRRRGLIDSDSMPRPTQPVPQPAPIPETQQRFVPPAPTGPAPVPPTQPVTARPETTTTPAAAEPAQVAPAESPATRREARQSFLTQEQVEEPATQGFRGLLTRAGLRMPPSDTERSERADVQAVSQHWPGPRTIFVANPKGGAGKTPTVLSLSAVFARHGGAGVLAYDNNQTRGTLGWRTEQGPHESTVLDLLPRVEYLLGTGAQAADLASFVHHQTRDRYDVLRSKPSLLAHEQRFDAASVDAIHAVAAKYYRLIIIDSGNDESDEMWLRALELADQLVVATTTRDDHAEAGALMLEALTERGGKYASLAAGSVAVVSQADQNATAAELARVASGYQQLTRQTVTIPFDPAMVDGVLNYASLRPTTQRAWLAAGAAVARGL